MILSHDFILFSIDSNQSILTESVITVYTAERQTVNLTFSIISSEIEVSCNKR